MTSEANAPIQMTAEQQQAAARPRPEAIPSEVKLWSHSTILYWWVVWVCGYLCAAITYFNGQEFDWAGDQGLDSIISRIHPNPWLGSAFLLVVLFIIIFSSVRVKGYIVLMVGMGVAIAALLADRFDIRPTRILSFELPPVHMSFGFYVVISTVLFFFWFVAVFVMDRLSFWRFRPGSAEQINFHFVEDHKFPTLMMQVRAKPVDFLRKLLGLNMTRDIVLSFNMGGNRVEFAVPNAWNVKRKLRYIESMNAGQKRGG